MSSIILNPFQLLEINIISAQDLAKVSRSMRTYAIAWVHPNRKLSTKVDSNGLYNPTWNDKFVFRVDEEFLQSGTSGVMIEIYSVHWFRDVLVGTLRVLVGNLVSPPSRRFRQQQDIGMRFVALQVHRPSGRPQGILNIGVALLDSSMRSMPLYTQIKTSAVGYRDLMGDHDLHHNQHILHYHNRNHQNGQPMQQLALPAPKPELRRTKSDSSSTVQGPRTLKRKVSFKERSTSVVGLTGQDHKNSLISVLSGSYNKEGLDKRGKSAPTGFDVGSNSIVARKDMYRTRDEEKSVVSGLSQNDSVEGLQSKLERWKMELPPIHDRGGEYSSVPSITGNKPSKRGRRNKQDRPDQVGGGGLFSCASNLCGCQCSIACGE